MRRRTFLGRAGTLGGAGLLGACGTGDEAVGGADAGSVTGPRVRWRLASSYPASLGIIIGTAEVLAARVRAITGGRFDIRVYPAGELVPGLQVMDAVQQGTVQAGHTASYFYIGKNPALAFDSGVPFGLTARQQNAWLYEGGGLELLRPVFAELGVVQLPLGNTGCQMGGWFRRPLESRADLSSIRMRVPGLGGEVFTRMGVTVQVLAAGDIFPALERGAIDATEFVGPYDDERLGFHQVAPWYYYPGFVEPGVTASLHLNRRAWEELPTQYKEVVEAVSREANQWMTMRYDVENPPALRRLVEDHGVRLRAFPDGVMEDAWEHSNALLADLASESSDFRRVLAGWRTFRDEAFRYFSGNELTYQDFAFRHGGTG